MDNNAGIPRKGRLYQLHTALAGSTAAQNRIFYVNADSTYVVHDDVSAAEGAANDPVVAGVFNCARSGVTLSPSTASTTYYVYLVCDGEATIATNGDDDIVVGDHIITDASTDGVCDSIAGGSTNTQTERTMRRRFGVAIADDDNSANTVRARISCPLKI